MPPKGFRDAQVMHKMMLIHGGNGVPAGMALLAEQLRPYADVWLPTMLGHGGRPLPPALSVPAIAADLLAQMDERRIERCFVGGYSFGGLLALYLARQHPARFCGVWTLAAKVIYDAKAVSHVVHLTSPQRVNHLSKAYAKDVRQRHAPQDWRAVMLLNQAMFKSLEGVPLLGENAWPASEMPALVISGELDPLVSADETRRLGAWLQSPVLMFPGAAHPLTAVPVQAVAHDVKAWMDWVSAAPESGLGVRGQLAGQQQGHQGDELRKDADL